MTLIGVLLLLQFVAGFFAAETNIAKFLQAKIQSEPPKTIKDASYVAFSLKRLGIDASAFSKVLCDGSFTFPSSSNLEEIYDAMILHKVMECDKLTIPSDLSKTLKSIYDDNISDFSPEMYHQFSHLLLLFSKNHLSGLVEEKSFLKKLFKDVDQKLRKKDTLSLIERSYFFESALPLAKVTGGKGEMSSVLKIQKSSVPDFFSLRYPDDLKTITKSGTAVIKLATTLKKEIEENRMREVLGWVLEKAEFEKMSYEELLNVILFLSSVEKYPKFSPVRILEGVKFTKGEKYEFTNSDLFGEPLKDKGVTVELYTPNELDEAFLSDIDLKQNGLVWEMALSDVDKDGKDQTTMLLAGEGPIIFEISVDEYTEKVQFLETPLSLKIIDFSFLNFPTDANLRTATGSPTGLSLSGSNKPFKVSKTNHNFVLSFVLSVETSNGVRITDFPPRQAFVRVLTPEQDWMKMVPSDEDIMTGKGTTYRLVLNFGHDRSFKNFISLGAVELIIGDTLLGKKTQVYQLGEIDFSEFRMEYSPSDEEEKYWKLPIIEHLYTAEPERATPIMANVFSGLVFFPFVIFFLGVLKFLGHVSIPPGFLYHVGLLASIGGSLVVIAMFWVEITVFQAFFWLFLCLVIGVLAGTKALRASHSYRTKRS